MEKTAIAGMQHSFSSLLENTFVSEIQEVYIYVLFGIEKLNIKKL